MNLFIKTFTVLVLLLIFDGFLNFNKLHSEKNFRVSRNKANTLNPHPDIIDISAANYPQPEFDKENFDLETVAIVGTADIHGRILPRKYFTLDTNESYETGGLLYFNNYLKILKEEWKENLLWLDAGDQFQGTIESNEFSGEAIVESLNYLNVSEYFTAAIGNHEFDFGAENLTKRIEQANFEYINSNIMNANTKERETFTKTKPYKIMKAGTLNIGIFAMSTVRTPITTQGNTSNYTFSDYFKVAEQESQILRKAGADIVLLIAHLGTRCVPGDNDDLFTNKVRYENTMQFSDCTATDELYDFLQEVPEGMIDGVIAGHTHNVVHHWINKMPVLQSGSNNQYFNILYITYDKKRKQIVKDEVKIEGPIPICEKVFEFTKRCDIELPITKTMGHLSQFSYHNKLITIDNDLQEHLKPYMIKALDYENKVFGFVENPMFVSKTEEASLGNFVADFIQRQTHSDVVLLNNGFIRVGWPKGKLTRYRIYETFPFEDIMVSCEMTGEELDKAVRIMQSGFKSFYSTAGLKQTVKNNPNRLIDVSLYDGSPIEFEKTYTVGMVLFLLKGGDDFKKVRDYYTPKNIKTYGKFREQVEEYIQLIGKVNTDANPSLKCDKPRLLILNDKKKLSTCS